MDVIPPRVCVFDVNETLLDLTALDPHFERVFGSAACRRDWFQLLLMSSWVATLVGDYQDFPTLGRAALETMAALREYFEPIFSVDSVPPYKPAPEPYHMAAERLGVPVHQVRMVAAHPW